MGIRDITRNRTVNSLTTEVSSIDELKIFLTGVFLMDRISL